MVQSQLVEYISSQVKLGVARDAIKSALVGAGWMEVDVEDTLKKVDAGVGASVRPAPSSPAASSKMSASSSAVSAKGTEPQSVRVSDLVSASGSATSFFGGTKTPATGRFASKDKPADPVMGKPQKVDMGSGGAMNMSAGRRSKGGLVMKIVGIVLILGFAGAAGYFYYENMGLSAQIAQLGGESSSVNSQITSLTNQVQAMTASNTALSGQVSSLTAENQTLLDNLSFAAVPPFSSGSTATETISIAGTLKSAKSIYELTTAYGVAVFVGNSKDALVSSALKPLLTSSSSVTLTGDHVPGSQYITVTGVNGVSLVPVAATTTAQTASSTTATTTSQ